MCRIQEEKKEKCAGQSQKHQGKNPDIEAADKKLDQEEKLQLVLSRVREHCHSDSPVHEFKTIHAALNAGDQLTGKILSGGYTNYSYKIFLANDPSCRLFAKVCFSYALWCPGKEKTHYDLERQTTEFRLMEHFSKTLRSGKERAPVATPHLLLDVSEDMRIIVTEWSNAEEQWANQFIEGQVDRRLVPRIANTMAKINLTTHFDQRLNQGMKVGLNKMMAAFGEEIGEIFEGLNTRKADECTKRLELLGKPRVDVILGAMREADKQKEVLAHADSHLFNVLVESKPDPEDLSKFGLTASFCLCDWEMAHWTAKGRDIGLLYSFPIAAAYFHAAQGHIDQAIHIIECLKEHWDVYSQVLRDEGKKSDQYLGETFRSGLGFAGTFLLMVFYSGGHMVDHLHKDGLSEDDVHQVMGLIGRTGIQFLEWAFMDDVPEAKLDLEGFRALFDETVEGDITTLSCCRRGRRPSGRRPSGRRPSRRRSSRLRAMGGRLSDASLVSLQGTRSGFNDM